MSRSQSRYGLLHVGRCMQICSDVQAMATPHMAWAENGREGAENGQAMGRLVADNSQATGRSQSGDGQGRPEKGGIGRKMQRMGRKWLSL